MFFFLQDVRQFSQHNPPVILLSDNPATDTWREKPSGALTQCAAPLLCSARGFITFCIATVISPQNQKIITAAFAKAAWKSWPARAPGDNFNQRLFYLHDWNCVCSSFLLKREAPAEWSFTTPMATCTGPYRVSGLHCPQYFILKINSKPALQSPTSAKASLKTIENLLPLGAGLGSNIIILQSGEQARHKD